MTTFTSQPSIFRASLIAVLVSATTLLPQIDSPSKLHAEPIEKNTTDGIDYSLDRLAFEVTKSLADRPALVIWLFDESGSVSLRRESIIRKLEQLWPAIKRPHPLYSSIVGLGKDIHFLTPQPVEDFPSLKQAADQLKKDDSGVESTFGAVIASLNRWKDFPDSDTHIHVSLVIVTDELGDDQERLEDAIAACKDQTVRVFCLGNAAPFGQPKGRTRFIYPDGFEEFIPVDQGPEVAIPETLRLPIWPPANPDPLKQVSSGLGPWTLSRLCAATGGQFFIVEDTGSRTFPRAAMADYKPSYEPLADLRKAAEASQLRQTLSECASRIESTLTSNPRFTFRADKAATARGEIQSAQRQVTILSDLTATSAEALKNCLEERDVITDKRLQAAFDLAYGRALLQTARAAELNYALAKMKIDPLQFTKGSSNTWTLHAAPVAEPARQNTDIVSRATVYLKRVVARHPDTPFAYFAQAELDRGTGWKCEESRRVYNDPPPRVVRPLLIQPKELKRRPVKQARPGL